MKATHKSKQINNHNFINIPKIQAFAEKYIYKKIKQAPSLNKSPAQKRWTSVTMEAFQVHKST